MARRSNSHRCVTRRLSCHFSFFFHAHTRPSGRVHELGSRESNESQDAFSLRSRVGASRPVSRGTCGNGSPAATHRAGRVARTHARTANRSLSATAGRVREGHLHRSRAFRGDNRPGRSAAHTHARVSSRGYSLLIFFLFFLFCFFSLVRVILLISPGSSHYLSCRKRKSLGGSMRTNRLTRPTETVGLADSGRARFLHSLNPRPDKMYFAVLRI